MERCLEEISSTVLDASEPISYRTLSIRSQVAASISAEALSSFSTDNSGVKVLQVLIKRAAIDNEDNKSETAVSLRDPRARVISLSINNDNKTDGILCQQIYALYGGSKGAENEMAAVTTACWAQERQARNDVLSNVAKHAPLSTAAKALYASGIKCSEATARQDFGEEQGEETISAFDNINTSAKKKSASSSSFFKSSGKSGFSKSTSSRSNGNAKSNKPEAKKVDMSNVLTIDSDDEEDDETDAPVFVKKTATNKRIIADDDDDEEDEAPAPKSRNVKRKLNSSPAVTKKAKPVEDSEEESDKKQQVESEDEVVEESVIATKRRLVSKTRINEQGYMVTEKTYEEVELTSEEIEKEQKAVKKKAEEKKKKSAAEKAAKAKKEAKKHSGPPKQRDLRSFFSVK
ncbi:hypothetical protein P3T76_009351 [Phytophthora citrophthora]|uniref:DNA polymerase delta subunit 3 n=1 Tax=Phytophthora citrophthora TaxID=4793 RepID=A0AAD9GGR2_9STRA|nr:hypothetical protein P3T76_009351 [Phytophthora citrophthora]